VMLGLYVADASHGQACPSMALVGQGIAHLRRPVGDRTLRHVVLSRVR
jgi:hypothetical protein